MKTQACRNRSLLSLSLLVAGVAFSSHAYAHDIHHHHVHDHRDHHGDRPSRLRLLGGMHFGIAGEIESERNGPFATSAERDLATTYGGHLGVDAVVLRFFAIGGEFRFSAWNTETAEDRDVDRSKMIDLDVKPRLRFAFARERLEFYFSTPVGLSVPILSDDIDAGGRIKGKPGFNLGVGGGLTFFLTHYFGLNVEPMYVMRWFKVEAGGLNRDVEMRQFHIFTNAVFTL